MTTYLIETFCPKCKNTWEINVSFIDEPKKLFEIVETICEKCGTKQRFEAARWRSFEIVAARNGDPEIIEEEVS